MMKTLTKILFAAALSGTAASYAGPSPQFGNRPASKPVAATEPARPAVQPDSSGLVCSRMFVPKTGAAKQALYTVVTCTSELMKSDWRCQQTCAKANKG